MITAVTQQVQQLKHWGLLQGNLFSLAGYVIHICERTLHNHPAYVIFFLNGAGIERSHKSTK